MRLTPPISAPPSPDPFGPRAPIDTDGDGDYDTGDFHYGQDYAAPAWTQIRAAGDGVVIVAGPVGTFGYAVYIDHGGGLVTRYAHMVTSPPVAVGWHVEAGDVIGYVGATGAATGNHLHFETVLHGERVDPIPYLTEEDDMYTDEDRARDNQAAKQIGEIHWMLDQRVRPQLDRLEGTGVNTGRDGKTRLQLQDEIHWMLEQRVRPQLDKLVPGKIEDDHTTHSQI